MWHIKTILHPTDFSAPAEEARRLACDLAREHEARLVALHVTPRFVIRHMVNVSELPPQESQEKLWEAIRRPRPEERGVEVEHRLAEGDPAAEILKTAADTRCDLIVMGTHGRSGLPRWFTGSVAEEVIRHASCPVLIAKARPAPVQETKTERETETELAGVGEIPAVAPPLP
ncbi:MAG: universal stress protein [Planctomycetes bacterium]|nr:universal stress protein [Planctomycetia bacterium]MBI3468830.1 universal stress protein [Planctomycetota bacterium]